LKTILFVISVLFCSSLFAFDATVKRAKGQAFVVRESKNIALKKGDKLNEGEVVQTGKKSFVQIRITDKGFVNVGPESEITISQMADNKPRIIGILKGQIRATFKDKKTKDHKLLVKTKSASMGVRGTDFHVIYNGKNNITSTISYEGDVELSSKFSMNQKGGDNIFGEDKVKVKPGEFSGVYSNNGYVNKPVRFSPKQWAALKKNTEIRLEEKKAEKPKKVDAKKIKERKNDFEKEIVHHHAKENDGIPSDLLGDTYRDVQKKEIELYKPKAGGYIDLKTAIYVAPPKGSRYDPKEDLYYPPEDYGSINMLTGEYIPPFGLVLVPLNGFVLASSKIQEGVKVVRENVTKVGKYFWDGAKDTTGAVYDGVKYIGKGLRENTGVVGETVGQGVDLVTDGVTKTVEYTTDTLTNVTGTTLNLVADNMNTYLYEGFLKKVGNVLKATPILNAFQLRLYNDFRYSSAQRFSIYDQLEEVVNVPTFRNEMKFLGAYKKFLSKDFFIRPKFNIMKTNHLRDELPELRNLDFYAFKYGLDLGLLKKFDKFTLQTYFFFYRANLYRYIDDSMEYDKYLKDTIYGFSKAIISNTFLTSRIDYKYTKFESDYFNRGDVHKLFISEIIRLNQRNYLNLDLYWSKQFKEIVNDRDINYGMIIKYHRYIPFHGMKVMGKLGVNWNQLGLENAVRGTEKRTRAGLTFTKVFGEFFSTVFEYEVDDIRSESNRFDNRSHNGAVRMNVMF
jgi:hypothetical protein